jgi:5,5'-dehydrodivanillate O-demethylase
MQQADFAQTGPGTLAGRYMRRFWHPVYTSQDLLPGRPARIQVMGEHFTLFRGEGGGAFLLQDRCPHRQTSLFLGWVEKDALRCFYHGWKFDGSSGQCVEMPAESPAYAERTKIRSYPVREYLGLVFAFLGEGEAPEFPVFPELEDPEGTGVRVVNRYVVPCNFFQRYENDLDEVHVHFVHAVSTKKSGMTEIPDVRVEETDYGILRQGIRSGGGGNQNLRGYHMMPNISMVDLVPSPEFAYRTFQVAWRVPIDDESMMTCSVGMRRVEPSRAHEVGKMKPAAKPDPDPLTLTADILAGKLRIQDVDPSYPALFILQDNVVLAAQGRVTERHKDKLGQSDKGVMLLRRIWQRELSALEEGKPLKEWRRPAEMMGGLVFATEEK